MKLTNQDVMLLICWAIIGTGVYLNYGIHTLGTYCMWSGGIGIFLYLFASK